MIIVDEKAVEASAEQTAEALPPPYSLRAPEVRIAVVNQDVPLATQPKALSTSTSSEIRFRARGSSSASLAPSSTVVVGRTRTPVPASSSSSYSGDSGSTIRSPEPYQYIPPPPDVPRTSFLRLQRKNKSISERIIVDPYLPFPPSEYHDAKAAQGREFEDDYDDDLGPRLGSPLPGDPDKRNVSLECKNGNVNTEVWLVGKDIPDVGEKNKAGIDVRAKNGSINVKIHASPQSASFSLRIACGNGVVRVALPHTFFGPLTTRSRNGWVSLSSALASSTTTFSEVRGTRKSFVGDFVDSGYGRGEWEGSSIDITCENGRIKLCYTGDDDEGKSSGGLLGRLFS